MSDRTWTVDVTVRVHVEASGPDVAAEAAQAAIARVVPASLAVGPGDHAEVEHVYSWAVDERKLPDPVAKRAEDHRMLQAAAGLDPECRLCRTVALPAYVHPLCSVHGDAPVG